jgi:hypothetical protein
MDANLKNQPPCGCTITLYLSFSSFCRHFSATSRLPKWTATREH